MEAILNFNEPLNVGLLDQIVSSLYSGQPKQVQQAQAILTQFQEHPSAWQRVDQILESSRNQNTRFYALSILENVIKYKWKVLPKEQCDGIKNYIVNLVIKLSSDPVTLQSEKLFIGKLNSTLVQIIKQTWPRHWETFISELVGASRTNESLCENNLAILKLMSEEVFDFSSGQMTAAKIKELKTRFNEEFSLVYQLCEYVLENAQKPSLLLVCLQTLLNFLNWIPLAFIFETKMIDTLALKFFPHPAFRTVTLECLTEVAALSIGSTHEAHFERLYIQTLTGLRNLFPPTADLEKSWENGSDDDQTFIKQLALFLTAFFKSHLNVVERTDLQAANMQGHAYLCQLSLVDDDDIFKICLEYWNKLATELYQESSAPNGFIGGPLMLGLAPSFQSSPRRMLYAGVLTRVRRAMIRRMPKPEEVLIVEDENGEIVRETMKDSDASVLYKSMRETLVLLTHLDPEDTQHIMLGKLANQVDGSEWSWHNLNTLCWAIGAISGALSEEHEKRFLVTVIKDLLGLTEMKRGKDNKAVVASNIMYIVGNYPRFLKAHWKFLKTVINKLFEFMHERHPGVQDMAVDTFLKIAQKCRRKFVTVQVGESQPFVDEILDTLPLIIGDLEQPQQVHIFYEAVGCMIQSHTDGVQRDHLLSRLMDLPNRTWGEIMIQASRSIGYLQLPETCKSIHNILKSNASVAKAMGPMYLSQFGRIYLDMLNVYKAYSENISNAIAASGVHATTTSQIRAMRAVKKETLLLIELFIEQAQDVALVASALVPPLLEAVLGDYKSNIQDAREPEVLSLMTVIVNKLQGAITKDVPRVFDSTFEVTLAMITKNFTDYPEHRLHFFEMLRAINQHCFAAFLSLTPPQFKLVVDSVVWAFKHSERNIGDIGLNTLLEMLQQVAAAGPEVSSAFYKSFFMPLLQDVFYVLTDTFHKSGFNIQAAILMHMVDVVESGKVAVPLYDPSVGQAYASNGAFLRDHIAKLLSQSFPNLTLPQVQLFVTGLFGLKELSAFKNHLRDFLVQLKEFSAGGTEDLFLEERELALRAQQQAEQKRLASVPGLIPQRLTLDDMGD